jgi:hypothetical protein
MSKTKTIIIWVVVLLVLAGIGCIIWIKLPTGEDNKTLTKENVLQALTSIAEDFGYEGEISQQSADMSGIQNLKLNTFSTTLYDSDYESALGLNEDLYAAEDPRDETYWEFALNMVGRLDILILVDKIINEEIDFELGTVYGNEKDTGTHKVLSKVTADEEKIYIDRAVIAVDSGTYVESAKLIISYDFDTGNFVICMLFSEKIDQENTINVYIETKYMDGEIQYLRVIQAESEFENILTIQDYDFVNEKYAVIYSYGNEQDEVYHATQLNNKYLVESGVNELMEDIQDIFENVSDFTDIPGYFYELYSDSHHHIII